MTATPIPRTLALTAYGDLDVSVIDEMPPGRTPIVTDSVPALRAARGRATSCGRRSPQGRQAYVVYPLVEESEKLEDVEAATEAGGEWAARCPASAWGCSTGG